VLGSARRVAQGHRVEPQAATIVEPAPAPDDATWSPPEEPVKRRVSSSRRAAARLREEARGGAPWGIAESGGWVYHTPFVTDTTLGDTIEPSHGGERGRAGSRSRQTTRRDRPADGPAIPGRRTGTTREDSADERDWPTVSDILAAQVSRPRAADDTRSARKTASRPMPTVSREPGHWRLPLWLGWFPAASTACVVGLAAMGGAWTWAWDAYSAGIVARRLAGKERGAPRPLPKGVTPPAGAWWQTTSNHLVEWAAYLDRVGDDPEKSEHALALLDRAAQASPLNATVRYAHAHPMPGGGSEPPYSMSKILGQSRDVLSMSWAGRRLLALGKKDEALRAYASALGMAARPDFERPEAPVFLDDSAIHRYAMPSETLLATVIADMAGSKAWSYKDWAPALPPGTAAALAAARVLRERGSADADAALDAALEGSKTGPAGSAPEEALRLASEAAALAMKRRWDEARQRYKDAIERMPVENVRRSWWLNVAYIARQLNEEADRMKALDLAKNADPKDEITVRAVGLQKESGYITQRSASRSAGTTDGSPETRR
jgi:tetratricopeptide (TPR) repeat protein